MMTGLFSISWVAGAARVSVAKPVFRFVSGLIFAAVSCAVATGSAVPKDEFSWLENPTDARALDWVKKQNDRTLAELTADPRFRNYYEVVRDIIRSEQAGLSGSGWPPTLHGDFVYTLEQSPSHPKGLLSRKPTKDFMARRGQAEVLIDMDRFATGERGRGTFLGITSFSPNGRRCLIAFSDGAGRKYELREFDLQTRAFVSSGFHLPAALSSVAWKDDDTLIVATDFGEGTLTHAGLPMLIKELRRGEGLGDARELFRASPTDIRVAIAQQVDQSGNSLRTIEVRDGTNKMGFWKIGDGGRVTQLSLPARVAGRLLHSGQYIFQITNEDWQNDGRTWKVGSLVSIPLEDVTSATPRVHSIMEPQPATSITEFNVTSSGLLVFGTYNVRGRLWTFRFEKERWIRTTVDLPDYGQVKPVGRTDSRSPVALIKYESFLHPPTQYSLDVRNGALNLIAAYQAPFRATDFVTEQLEARSSDGTRVPYFLTRPRKQRRDAPALVYGYGAASWALTPSYSAVVGKLWLEQGGVYVVANIRGGGEFGPTWHVTGKNREKTYDDMIAVVEDLVARRISARKRVGISGFSSGGLLAGVMLTQRPDLFGSALIKVPYLDQFRPDLTGYTANMLANEFGSPDDAHERAFLERTSPFQNLKTGPDFPVPFLITSTTDDTAFPAQARRFGAKMEQLGMPFLYYETAEGGHNAAVGIEDRARLDALSYVYLARQLMDGNRDRAAHH